jgi:hypothetical protein
MGAVCMALEQTSLGTGIRHEDIQALNMYWSQVRMLYSCFEANVRASDSSVFDHEMPGGQYTNLMVRAKGQCLCSSLMARYPVPSFTAGPWNTMGGCVFFLWRELPFQLNTFTAVIKQKYIEANDLVSLTLELFHPLKYDTPRFFLSKCGNIIKVITRKYGIAARLPI